MDLHFLRSLPLFLYVRDTGSKTASACSYLPKEAFKQRSLVMAKKSEPVSKRTFTGVSSEPK